MRANLSSRAKELDVLAFCLAVRALLQVFTTLFANIEVPALIVNHFSWSFPAYNTLIFHFLLFFFQLGNLSLFRFDNFVSFLLL